MDIDEFQAKFISELTGIQRTKNIRILFRLPLFDYFLAWDRKTGLFLLAKKMWEGDKYVFKVL